MEGCLVSKLGLQPDALRAETIIVTGAGDGIGYEAARALLWLGANVVIAEIDLTNGKRAEKNLSENFDPGRLLFVQTDIGNEQNVHTLYLESISRFGRVDAIINNATIAPVGAVKDLPIELWDASYQVNLRGPVLLARQFLPDMIERKHGAFVCVSSNGTGYLGGYETFKTAQAHLADTLDAELEGTGVVAYTISPGLVPTRTASAAIKILAPRMGMTIEEFYKSNKNLMLTPEEAGTGFAVSLLFADQFKGSEISSIQALKAANINYESGESYGSMLPLDSTISLQAKELCRKVHSTLKQQSEGWRQRSIFERQWVVRDFRKTTGMSVEEWLQSLKELEKSLLSNKVFPQPPLSKLAGYYGHLADLAKGYEKDTAKLEENLRYVNGWRDEVIALENTLNAN